MAWDLDRCLKIAGSDLLQGNARSTAHAIRDHKTREETREFKANLKQQVENKKEVVATVGGVQIHVDTGAVRALAQGKGSGSAKPDRNRGKVEFTRPVQYFDPVVMQVDHDTDVFSSMNGNNGSWCNTDNHTRAEGEGELQNWVCIRIRPRKTRKLIYQFLWAVLNIIEVRRRSRTRRPTRFAALNGSMVSILTLMTSR